MMPSSASDKPFGHLQSLLDRNQVRLAADRPATPTVDRDDLSDETGPADDQALFRRAMADVVPLKGRSRRISGSCTLPIPDRPAHDEEDREALERLQKLVTEGTGFDWSFTDEYVEHAASCIHPEVARQLHEGRFSVQAHIDLHGLSMPQAKTAVDRFLHEAVRTRKCAVMIIHGRGLSSPGLPVLKTGLVRWLNSGPWRRWIAAFASARACDGGAGATYVLLRPTPAKGGRRRRPSTGHEPRSTPQRHPII